MAKKRTQAKKNRYARRQAVKRKVLKGKPDYIIAEETGWSQSTIARDRRRFGLKAVTSTRMFKKRKKKRK